MKVRGIAMAVAVLGLTAGSLSAHEMPGAAPNNPGFERLKMLLGDWEGTSDDGKPVTISYSMVSGRTALLEKIGPMDEPEMVTLYSTDGRSVLMTHYCGVGNQPRMRATGTKSDAKMMDFAFVDCANLSAPDAGHMHHLMMTFDDKDHYTQEWTWKEKKAEGKHVFHLARKKTS